MSELAAAHAVGAAFGAGAGGQTTPETDGGNFVEQGEGVLLRRRAEPLPVATPSLLVGRGRRRGLGGDGRG